MNLLGLFFLYGNVTGVGFDSQMISSVQLRSGCFTWREGAGIRKKLFSFHMAMVQYNIVLTLLFLIYQLLYSLYL